MFLGFVVIFLLLLLSFALVMANKPPKEKWEDLDDGYGCHEDKQE